MKSKNHVITRKQAEQSMKQSIQSNVVIPNTTHRCHPELVSGSQKKFAFTLAEILITLGIIGIVAAMTISTLMSKIQEKRYTTQYKKIFNELNQTMKMLENDKNSPITMCKSFDYTCFRDLFATKIKVSHTCDGAPPNKCITSSTFLNKQTLYYTMINGHLLLL